MATQMGQQITVDFDVPATMRDGTVLRANVYRPVGEGQWPVLLTRLPYGKDFSLGTLVMDPAQVARRGYVVSTAAQIHDKPGHWSFLPPWKSPACQRSFQFPTGYFSRSRFSSQPGWNVALEARNSPTTLHVCLLAYGPGLPSSGCPSSRLLPPGHWPDRA